MITIRRAFLSASDKSGLPRLAKGLKELGVDVLASGGTQRHLLKEGVEVGNIRDYIGYPDLVGGRVKTLHPLIHAGILARRDREDDLADVEKHGIRLIDLVAVNLYPFEQRVRGEISIEEAMEWVDIGGEALIRAAAKNHRWVAAVVDPSDYVPLLREIEEEGALSEERVRSLAAKAFDHVTRYNAAVSRYLRRETLPPQLNVASPRALVLRAGENRHQQGALYSEDMAYRKLQGKDPSFNNLLDLDAAAKIAHSFAGPTAVVVKHTNPCGLATAATLEQAFPSALAADAKSAFGGIVGVNRPLSRETAEQVAQHFFDALIAPAFEPGAAEILAERKNLLVIELPGGAVDRKSGIEIRDTSFGLVAQSPSTGGVEREHLTVVSERHPTEQQLDDLLFAWQAVRWVKSNAIVLARDACTAGIGAGQMSRVDATELAIRKAAERARGSVLASDAFFPFRDSVDLAAAAGITAIIEPGGSIRDDEVIRASNEHALPLVFTGQREFRH